MGSESELREWLLSLSGPEDRCRPLRCQGERVGKIRDVIGSKLAPDQLEKAQDLARNWKLKK